MFGKIKESIDKSIVSVSVKSGTYLEIEKLKAKIGNVQGEIVQLKTTLGNFVYQQWEKESQDQNYIDAVCRQLRSKEEEIVSYEQQMTQLMQEKERILKGSGDVQPVPEGGISLDSSALREKGDKVVCACGQANSKDAKFCRGCGARLDMPEETAHQIDSEERHCPRCNAILDAGTRFCSECGTLVE